jgi:hypothetical protein
LFFKGKPAFKVEYDKIKEVLDREILKLIDQGD